MLTRAQAATKGVTPAWFKVRPPHTLLLTGFPAEPKGTLVFFSLDWNDNVLLALFSNKKACRKPNQPRNQTFQSLTYAV